MWLRSFLPGKSKGGIEMTLRPGTQSREDVFATYRPVIYRQALGLLHEPDDADDATQDVLVRVFRFLPHFERRASLSTWIYRITYNVCMDYAKRRRRLWRVETYAQLDMRRGALDSWLEHCDTDITVKAALNCLPDKYRIPLFLHYFIDLPYHEISARTGVPVNTIKIRVYRAKRILGPQLSTLDRQW